mmetsp:Transcript_25634/g.19392  ORF Transcript_25634/g.19392 Transcript_25634/m.19392 type:complete len:97 (-) Transcript_25634:195-485(-)
MYYKYYYYSSQGMSMFPVPIPVLGNVLDLRASLKRATGTFPHPALAALHTFFKGKMPPAACDFRFPDGVITFSDPELVNEIYLAKNKFYDKHPYQY